MKTFYKNKKILITGHTGFKGSWLVKILDNWDSDITGYSLQPPTTPNLYDTLEVNINNITADIRDYDKLLTVFKDTQPEIVIHMAAQPLVLEGYKNPKETYQTNVMGTVNICEAIKNTDTVKSFVNITTDKVYQNDDTDKKYKENDKLNGYDPYSNSKSCSDIITQSYYKSFYRDVGISTSTIRSGNVIGGGDFAKDRIIPDCIKAALKQKTIQIRNPNSIRPYQHVLEPLNIYLKIAKEQYKKQEYSSTYNIGPDEKDCINTKTLVELFCKYWGENQSYEILDINGPHEAKYLKLDSNKIKEKFNWTPRWNVEKAIEKTVEWAKAYQKNTNTNTILNAQIEEFFKKKIGWKKGDIFRR